MIIRNGQRLVGHGTRSDREGMNPGETVVLWLGKGFSAAGRRLCQFALFDRRPVLKEYRPPLKIRSIMSLQCCELQGCLQPMGGTG